MKTILFYGNCQVAKLFRIFQLIFSKKSMRTLTISEVHHIKSAEYFTRPSILGKIQSADMVVMQNVQSEETNPFQHIVPFLKDDTHIVTVDSLYCGFFHPELVKSRSLPTITAGSRSDFNIIEAWIQNVPLSTFIKNDPFNVSNFYTDEYLDRQYKSTIDKLKKRYIRCDSKVVSTAQLRPELKFSSVDITDFLKDRRNIKTTLWGDCNHPFNPVFKYVTQKICKRFDIEFNETKFDENFNCKRNEGGYIRPPCKSVIEYFGFDEATEHRNYSLSEDYKNVPRSRYVSDVYSLYKECDKKILKSEYDMLYQKRLSK